MAPFSFILFNPAHPEYAHHLRNRILVHVRVPDPTPRSLAGGDGPALSGALRALGEAFFDPVRIQSSSVHAGGAS